MAFPEEKLKSVYTIVDGKGERQRWVRIGIGFVNRDASINVRLDAMPVNGKIHIRDYSRPQSEAAIPEPLLGDDGPAIHPAVPLLHDTQVMKGGF